MPGAPQAKFEFVATGDAQVNAQVQGVVDKLVRMKLQAVDTTNSTAEGMEKAHLSAHLLNEELGLGIPRAMQTVISKVPGLSSALSAAFSITAAVGFVEIFNTLLEKMPELTDALMGFGAKAKEAFDQLKSDNEAIFRAIEQNGRQAASDLLLGLSGSALEKAQQAQLNSRRDALRSQVSGIGTANAKILNQTITEPEADEQGILTGRMRTIPKPLSDDDQAALDANNHAAAQLTLQITQLTGEIDSLGKHITQSVGDEGKAAADKFAQAVQKAKDEVTKIIPGLDEMIKAPQEQETDAVAKVYNDQIAVLQQFGQKAGLTEQQITAYITQLLALRGQAVQQKLNDINKQISSAQQKYVSNALASIGFAFQNPVTDDPFKAMQDSFTKSQQMLATSLENEAVAEKLVNDEAKVSGDSQYAVEQRLYSIRTAAAQQMQQFADNLKQIALSFGGEDGQKMLEMANRFQEKINDLQVKTASWITDLKVGLGQDVENTFLGLTTLTETWSQAFQKAGQEILAMLAKIVYQMYIAKLVQSALGSLFGGGASPISIGSSTGNGLATALGAVPHALGGPVFPGQTYLVGERGPELFRAGASGSIIPNSQIGGGGMPLQVNIHNYGQPMEQSQTSRFDGTQYIVDVVVKNIQSNGGIRQALKS